MRPVRLLLAAAVLAALVALTLGGPIPASGGAERSDGDWGEEPQLTVSAVGDEYPELDVTLELESDAGVPGRIAIYVPAGFPIYPERPIGSTVAEAHVHAADFAYGAGATSLLYGELVAEPLDAAAEASAQSCSPGTHVAVWHLRLSLLGQPVDIPIYVAPPTPSDPPGAELKLELCAPVLPAPQGSLAPSLPIQEIRLSFPDLEAPRVRGSYLWRALVTPLAPDRRTSLPEKAYELRAVVPVPHRLTLEGTYLAKAQAAVLRGKLLAAGKPRAGVRVDVVRLDRTVTPSGRVIWNDAPAGSTRTTASGTYSFRARMRKTAGFVALAETTVRRCEGAAAAPGGCVSTTTVGTASEPVTLSVPRPPRRR